MRELTHDDLGARCDPTRFSFVTTEELEDLEHPFGQDRAVEALNFGLGIRHDGYHLFVLGPVGVGRHRLVSRLVEARAAGEDVPDDWVYVHRFSNAWEPNAIRLPAGRGVKLREDMQRLVEDLPAALASAFDTDEYRARLDGLREHYEGLHTAAIKAVHELAAKSDLRVMSTPGGLVIAVTRAGEVATPAQLEGLSDEEQDRIRAAVSEVQERLSDVLRQIPRWETALREAVRELDRETTARAVAHLIEGVRRRFEGIDEMVAYLERVQADIVDNAHRLRAQPQPQGFEALLSSAEDFTRRYLINVLVDNTDHHGAPVVVEDDPTLPALVGRVEYRPVLGALRTDHTMIRPGALHRANGGYLVLDALHLLTRPLAWEHLKRALRSREIRFGTVADYYGATSTVSLEPEAIPLHLKVLVVGDRRIHHLLSELDRDFPVLFKVAVDLQERVDRDDDIELAYARLVATLAREDRLLPFSVDAVAAIVDRSARMAGDQHKLTTHLDRLTDLLQQADHHARLAGRETVERVDVAEAVAAALRRSSRVRDELLEQTLHDTLHVLTSGTAVGQVNGLSVLQVGTQAFGRPARITARVRLGAGKVLDIEREVELGGPIHSKGVLILTGYLGARYASDRPLAMSASLVFEQSYGGIEGDSASIAETCALLSVLAELPVRQDVGITGSIDQQGRAQAVGGINEKIEGFFDLCAARGLTGSQGVMIPEANVRHVVLRDDIRDAIGEGRFHLWAMSTVDDALALLTGVDADEVHARVDARLAAMAERAREFGKGEGSGARRARPH